MAVTASLFTSNVNDGRAIEDFTKAIELRTIEKFTKGTKRKPNAGGNYGNRGDAYFLLRQYDLAIKDYDNAIRLKRKNASAYRNRVFANYFLGKNDRVADDFRNAARLAPSDHYAIIWLSIVSA